MLSQTDLQMSSIESALLLDTTASDLNRFLTVSLVLIEPVVAVFSLLPPADVPLLVSVDDTAPRERLRLLHSLGIWSMCVDDCSSPPGMP